MREEGLDSLHPRTRAVLERELERGERLLWCASPGPGAVAFGTRFVPILGGVVFLGFALAWMGMAWFATRSAPDGGGQLGQFFPLFGLPFLLFGIAFATSPWWYLGRRVRRIAHALTDRRAIVASPGFGSYRVQSFRPGDVARIEKTIRDDGSGDLEFVVTVQPSDIVLVAGLPMRVQLRGPYRPPAPGFQGVANVNEVEARLRSVLLPRG